MKGHTLHKVIFRGFDNLNIATLQGVGKGYGRCAAAYNRDTLHLLRLIFFNAFFCNRINAGHKLNIHRTVCLCGNGLVYAVSADCKTNTVYFSVLRVFDDMTDSRCLSLDVHIEVHGIFRTGYHCLLAGVSPNKEIANGSRNNFLSGYADSIFNHLLRSKGVFVAVSCNSNPFIGSKMNVRQKVVGIG